MPSMVTEISSIVVEGKDTVALNLCFDDSALFDIVDLFINSSKNLL